MDPVGAVTPEQVKLYFYGDTRRWPWILAIGGFLFWILIPDPLGLQFFIVSLRADLPGLLPSVVGAVLNLGFIVMALGVFFILYGRKLLVSDEQIDAWTERVLASHRFDRRAGELSRFREIIIEPVILRGVAGGEILDGVELGERFCKDGVYRANPISITVFFATADQIGVFQTGVDLVTGNRVNERFSEIYYQDVTTITIGSSTNSVDFKALMKRYRRERGWFPFSLLSVQTDMLRFLKALQRKYRDDAIADIVQWEKGKLYRLQLVNGTSIEVATADGRLTTTANRSKFVADRDGTAQAMVTFRNFVRDKKRELLKGRETVFLTDQS